MAPMYVSFTSLRQYCVLRRSEQSQRFYVCSSRLSCCIAPALPLVAFLEHHDRRRALGGCGGCQWRRGILVVPACLATGLVGSTFPCCGPMSPSATRADASTSCAFGIERRLELESRPNERTRTNLTGTLLQLALCVGRDVVISDHGWDMCPARDVSPLFDSPHCHCMVVLVKLNDDSVLSQGGVETSLLQ